MNMAKNLLIIICLIMLTSCSDDIDSDVDDSGNNNSCVNVKAAMNVLGPNDPIPNVFRIPTPGDEVKFIRLPDDVAGPPQPMPDMPPVTWVVHVITEAMGVGAQKLFEGINDSTDGIGFEKIIKLCIVLSIMYYGASILIGATQANTQTAIFFFMKIVIIWYLATDWPHFKDFVVDGVEGLVLDLSGTMANVFSGVPLVDPNADPSDPAPVVPYAFSYTFESVDRTLFMFFSSGFWKVLLAMARSGWAFFFAVILIIVIAYYLWGVLGAIRVYLMSLIARHLLYAVAPIYFTFMLFKKTESLFFAWLEQMVSFSLQPIFLFAFFGMFNIMIINFIQSAVVTSDSVEVCVTSIFPEASFFSWIKFWGFKPEQQGPGAEVPLNWWALIALCVLARMMLEMTEWCVEVAARISGGLVTVSAPVRGWDDTKDRHGNTQKGFKSNMKVKRNQAIFGAARGGIGAAKGATVGNVVKGYDGKTRLRGGLFNAAWHTARSAYKGARDSGTGAARFTGGLGGFASGAWQGLKGAAVGGWEGAKRPENRYKGKGGAGSGGDSTVRPDSSHGASSPGSSGRSGNIKDSGGSSSGRGGDSGGVDTQRTPPRNERPED